MSFQTPITIREAIQKIQKREYLLPAIQREFVWKEDQVLFLFDSLMRRYPIGSFLFWDVEKERINDFQFYEFLQEFHERDCRHNSKISLYGYEDITAILDGQQRLTALYLGLKGSFASKLPHKRKNNDLAYPKRSLFVNLLAGPDDSRLDYDFRFLTRQQASVRSVDEYWFRVGDVLKFEEEFQVSKFILEIDALREDRETAERAHQTLFQLHSVVNKDPVVNYFLERDPSLDKVLNIFIRMNSGGTELSYSDLLLSIATAQWKDRDAREEVYGVVDELNRIGDGFAFEKDFVLRACLVLCDFADVGFKVDNFGRDNMIKMEAEWEQITQAIQLAVSLVASLGFSRDTLTSANAVIPIAYYLHRIGSPEGFVQKSVYLEDRSRIRTWLVRALLRRAFGGKPEQVLNAVRGVLRQADDGFPLENVIKRFKGTPKTLDFSEEDIESLLALKYGKSLTFSALSLLYPWIDYRNKFHADHIFPKAKFSKRKLRSLGMAENHIDDALESRDRLSNLQLLPGTENQEKSDTAFNEWYVAIEDKAEYRRRHLIPEGDWSLRSFNQFIEAREQLLKHELRKALSLQGADEFQVSEAAR